MSLLAKIDQKTFESLPESTQEHYVALNGAQQGSFVLDVKPVEGWGLEDIKGLKDSLRKEREDHRKLQGQFDRYKGDDGTPLDPEELSTKLKRLAEFEGMDLDQETQKRFDMKEQQLVAKYDGERKKLQEKHQAETAALKAENSGLGGQLSSTLIDNACIEAIRKHRGSVDLLLPILRGHCRIGQDDRSRRCVEVIDPHDRDGQPRMSERTGSRDNMQPEELVEIFKNSDQYARAFDGTGASGSGATGTGTQRSTGGEHPYRITADDAKDHQKYLAARAKAKEAGKTLEIVEPSR